MNNPALLRWAAVALAALTIACIAALVVTVQAPAPVPSNAQLAAEIDSLGGRQFTPADVDEIVGFVCSPDPADRAGYDPHIVSLVRAAGRCGR